MDRTAKFELARGGKVGTANKIKATNDFVLPHSHSYSLLLRQRLGRRRKSHSSSSSASASASKCSRRLVAATGRSGRWTAAASRCEEASSNSSSSSKSLFGRRWFAAAAAAGSRRRRRRDRRTEKDRERCAYECDNGDGDGDDDDGRDCLDYRCDEQASSYCDYDYVYDYDAVIEKGWMCGLCGDAFLTRRCAEEHEARCVGRAFGPGGVNVWMGRLPTDTVITAGGGGGASTRRLGAPRKEEPVDATTGAAAEAGAMTVKRHRRYYSDQGVGRGNEVTSLGLLTTPPSPRRARTGSSAASVAAGYHRNDGNRDSRYHYRYYCHDGCGIVDVGTASAISVDADAQFRRPERGYVPLPPSARRRIVMTDEAVIKVCGKASPIVLSPDEADAERELALLARDRAYYDALAWRRIERPFLQRNRNRRRFPFLSPNPKNGGGALGGIKSRFAEAYRLIKEEDAHGSGGAGVGANVDVYSARGARKVTAMPDIGHDGSTLYINVIVKNGAQVINHELDRLAKLRWERDRSLDSPPGGADRASASSSAAVAPPSQSSPSGFQPRKREFEWFRHFAQYNVVRLAGLALASDFTPRKIAVQLSNDLYRLMAPRLRRRGVSIETEIEYRVGAYFVLGVNITDIDWITLMKYTHREVEERKRIWSEEKVAKRTLIEVAAGAGAGAGRGRVRRRGRSRSLTTGGGGSNNGAGGAKNDPPSQWRTMFRLYVPTKLEFIAQCLAWLHRTHWVVSVPTCLFWYHLVLRNTMRRYILASTTDEIFQYVERKGMEMEMEVCEARKQASFMLSALRELRADERELKKKKAEAEKGEAGGTVLGPHLGPDVKEDKGPVCHAPGWVPPENLEDVNVEMDLPVGFRRLRWALLHKDSKFMVEAVMKAERKYENIVMGDWSEHNDLIGLPNLPVNVKAEQFVDVSKESEYLMPKSAFVKANMCYEKTSIVEYNDHCFAYHGTARTPEVPYGGTFVTHTRVVITNKGSNRCRMVCSVEAEFPNGPPMIARQIKSGMRAGTAESFVALGETVCRYADEYP